MILDEIALYARYRVEERKREVSLEEVKIKGLELARQEKEKTFPFEKALKNPGLSFICEVKKASPSKGLIAQDFPYLEIAKAYERAGAAAISVLTEPKYFLGDDKYLKEIAATVKIPVLRKDFVVDEYQIYEAKVLGASAVLLICAILDKETLLKYKTIADTLGLSSLVEAHTEEEIETALSIGARIIGVNNRNLKTFQVDNSLSLHLRKMIPDHLCYVSESGVRGREDVIAAEKAGADGILVGEALMRSRNKEEMLAKLQGRN